MKRVHLCFVLLLLSAASFGQAGDKKVIDSLYHALYIAKDDTTKVNQYNQLSKRLWIIGRYDNAMYNANHALVLAEKANFKKGIANAYNNVGVVNVQQANYGEALRNYGIALNLRKEIGEKYSISFSYINIGNVYLQLGNYPESLKNYFAALKIAEKAKSDFGVIAIVHGGLGNIYALQGNYTEALKNDFEALQILQAGHDPHGMAMTYGNIGDIYVKQGNYTEAIKFFLTALRLLTISGDKLTMAGLYGSIGNVYLQQNKYAESLKNYLAALAIQQEMNYKFGIADSYINIGRIYFKQKKMEDARQYLQDGLTLAREMDSKDEIKEAYNQLSKLDSSVGNINGSYQYYKLYARVKDSLVNESSNKQISLLKIQYETDKNEKEIALLNSENRIKAAEVEKQIIVKYVAFAVTLLTILIAILFLYNYRIREKTRQLSRANEIRQRISRDLHDEIGAGLTSISMRSEWAKVNTIKNPGEISIFDKISSQSHGLNEKLSEVVWATNPENDNLVSLISYMRNYILRFFEDSTIRYNLNLPEDVPSLSLKPDVSRNLFFVLKEALNNCSKHSQASTIEVLFKIDSNQQFVFFIHDNGIGINDKIISGYRNGLGNMRKRIEEINGKFEIKSEIDRGTKINIIGSLS